MTFPTITFTSTKLLASVNLTVDSTLGTFATSTSEEKASFSISTNNYTGYTLTLRSASADTSLTNGTGVNAHTLSAISLPTTGSTFASNNSAGQMLNNKWGYIPNYYNATGTSPTINTTNYYPLTTNNTVTLRTTSVANSSNGIDNADNYTIGLGIRADYTNPSGDYVSNTIILEYVANPMSYVINYDNNVGNTGDNVTNMPNSQIGANIATSQEYVILGNNTPVRSGYFFLGWCEGSTIITTNNSITGATINSCVGTVYQPSDNFYFDATTSNTVTLKAMWEQKTYMQDFTIAMCSNMPTNTSLNLYDKRDDVVYLIGKLADGKCWMLDNLALGSTTLKESISSTNTNIPTNHTFSLPSASSPWNTDSADAYTSAKYNVDYANITTTTYGIGSGKVGVYYNFCAASAGTYCYDSNSGTIDATYDICPSGWRMAKSYTALLSSYGSDWSSFLSALSVTMSGEIWNGAVGKQGSAANLWSASVSNKSMMSRLKYDNNDSHYYSLHTDAPRSLGWTVRCVKKTNPVTITFAATSNAGDITLGGVTYTNGQTTSMESDSYRISAIGTAFGSWSTTGSASVVNASSASTELIISGNGTISLNEADVGYISATWSQATEYGASLYIRGAYDHNGGIDRIMCPTWAVDYGQNPILWYKANWDSSANAYRCDFTMFDFDNYNTIYTTHIYIYDGNSPDTGHFISAVYIKIPAKSSCISTPFSGYMQDVTMETVADACEGVSGTMTDRRDGKTYTVKKINKMLWMTQNLRITGTISAADSNFSSVSSFNVSQYSLDSADSSYSGHCDSSNSVNYACSKVSGSTTTGAWYNYYAATAGTISTSSNNNNATEDICPTGWRIPTGPNTIIRSDINRLVGNSIADAWQNPTDGLTAFGAVDGGHYTNGSLNSTNDGVWWSNRSATDTTRYNLLYNSSRGQFLATNNSYRYQGFFIRCARPW